MANETDEEAPWSNNNRAHVATWNALIVLGQRPRRFFKNEGKTQMKELQFWSDIDSPDMRKTHARQIAVGLNGIFIGFNGAKYEQGCNAAKSVTRMTNILIQSDQTIADLGGVADDCYHFQGEGTDV